ncbi:UDP-glucose--hexose-1-phosphate uridylyltransferase [Pontibacter sp. SGAir0037]|uniref:UDP-glucose--hexose-1-phosphate uridylyltransferase n=1 Tax=Pontibacter sp. SGAir0037 TaxID=2571030 RepID=UPI0010CD442E|nr:UDP-glucose--hexose-1-phosphate uridylyltransferase [Pontibacter sp. SGAir0037]QCR22229.1 galactose-1-phosphate uridylyltransferase [Pontibacter sp. SGAir0037]
MSQFNFEDHSHRRYNPLTAEWVQVSPHRAKRPWQGQEEQVSEAKRPAYDPTCYLCPGNTRANGEVNPDYTGTYSFQNDFAAITEDVPSGEMAEGEFFLAKSERGLCKVICFSPRHDLTIPEMEVEGIKEVVELWKKEYVELGARDYVNYVQIFENKGQVMGCSNPHPHGQIWAQESIPDEPLKKQLQFSRYYEKYGRTMLIDYLHAELEKKDRILFENEHFVGLIPFWAVWPFEAMIIPRRHISDITALTDAETRSLADAYKQLTVMYDNIFGISFPYSAGIHQAPTDGKEHPEWDMHLVFYPPLLRSATVKKFMVGYEMLANPQRDITPETSAALMRKLPKVHYKLQK